ncbi:MAG: hypothetical protein GEU90_00800 [Gemmatimonas sp.]|nr:hypothetical protein [Gemmatimonas sp.]
MADRAGTRAGRESEERAMGALRYRTWMLAGLQVVGGAVQVASGQEADLPAREPSGSGLELTLDQAITKALGESQEVALARSQVTVADAQVTAARSPMFPQISANLGYTKTFASSFDTGGGFELPDSLQFNPDPSLPLEERVSYLEQNAPLAGLSGLGGLFGDLPFAQENAYSATLNGQQVLWSGGRLRSGVNIARNAREAAEYALIEEAAETELQVKTAYYQVLLADELETIATAALEQAQAFLDQEELRFEAGQASELDVMRAEVTLENLRPQLIEAQNAAELATLNLKRLTDIPASVPLTLTTGLMENLPAELEEPGLDPEVLTAQRAAVRSAQEQIEIREGEVDIARGAFLPNVALQMSYGRQAFPVDVFGFSNLDWRTDWTATLSVSVPLFTGFQRMADVERARAQLEQAHLQLVQLEESVQLQYQQALGEKRRAQAEIAARERTEEQAQRVYDLTVLRYDQGLATQLEVSDARLSLLEASTNLAQAVTSFHVADAGVSRAMTSDAAALPSVPSTLDTGPIPGADGTPQVPAIDSDPTQPAAGGV